MRKQLAHVIYTKMRDCWAVTVTVHRPVQYIPSRCGVQSWLEHCLSAQRAHRDRDFLMVIRAQRNFVLDHHGHMPGKSMTFLTRSSHVELLYRLLSRNSRRSNMHALSRRTSKWDICQDHTQPDIYSGMLVGLLVFVALHSETDGHRYSTEHRF